MFIYTRIESSGTSKRFRSNCGLIEPTALGPTKKRERRHLRAQANLLAILNTPLMNNISRALAAGPAAACSVVQCHSVCALPL